MNSNYRPYEDGYEEDTFDVPFYHESEPEYFVKSSTLERSSFYGFVCTTTCFIIQGVGFVILGILLNLMLTMVKLSASGAVALLLGKVVLVLWTIVCGLIQELVAHYSLILLSKFHGTKDLVTPEAYSGYMRTFKIMHGLSEFIMCMPFMYFLTGPLKYFKICSRIVWIFIHMFLGSIHTRKYYFSTLRTPSIWAHCFLNAFMTVVTMVLSEGALLQL